MSKVAVIGKYNAKAGIADGQAVKTRVITSQLKDKFGSGEVMKIDTYNWKKHPFRLLMMSIRAVFQNRHVIFMTDEGGIKVFPWLLLFLNLFKGSALHYVVVGGWLIHFVKDHHFISNCLKKFSGVYVETKVMKQALEAMGFLNIILLPNFKPLRPLESDKIKRNYEKPFRFCTFSRVMKEKGIEDAAKAIKSINEDSGKAVCTLDIYGQVEPAQREWFEKIKGSFAPEVRYCGVIEYSKSVDALKEYYALLFPTKFYTEGVPGTIIDAYASAVPVVASRWESFSDLIDEGETGISYEFGSQEGLKDAIRYLIENPEITYNMKIKCLERSKQYLPENLIDILLKKLS